LVEPRSVKKAISYQFQCDGLLSGDAEIDSLYHVQSDIQESDHQPGKWQKVHHLGARILGTEQVYSIGQIERPAA
jgi:hypothetical protein